MSGQATARDIELLFQTKGFWARNEKPPSPVKTGTSGFDAGSVDALEGGLLQQDTLAGGESHTHLAKSLVSGKGSE